VSNSTETSKKSSSRGACCAWTIIAALVFLRLCVGWHFFSEGIKKVEVDSSRGDWNVVFSAEGFLRQAKGPLAGFYQGLAPSTSNWQDLLAVPDEATPEEINQLTEWVERYVQVRQRELSRGEQGEPEFPEFAPYVDWAEQIQADWKNLVEEFSKVPGLTEEQRERATELLARRIQHLADYLAQESLDIQTYRHELWRLEQAQESGGAEEIPFREERIAEKSAEVTRTPLKWVAGVGQLRDGLADDLRYLLSEEQHGTTLVERVDSAVADSEAKTLNRMNVLVTCITITVGVLLLVGLFSRFASLVGAVFLLSIMATQPPWVAGANTMYFYYQLVEFAALLLLMATAAGRYAGLDFIIHGLLARRRSTQGAKA